jgi:hypothetical protein
MSCNKISEEQYNNIFNPNPIIVSGNVYNSEEFNESRWYYSNRESFNDFNNSQIKIFEDSNGSRILSHKYKFNGKKNIDNFHFSVIRAGSSKYIGKGKNIYGTYMYKIRCINNRIYSFNIEIKYYKLTSPKSVKQIKNFSVDQIHTSRKRKSFDLGKVHNDLSKLVVRPRKTRSFDSKPREREEANMIENFLKNL